MINHITYHVPLSDLRSRVDGLMRLLGFEEVQPDDPFEHGWQVRWYRKTGSPLVHFVATNDDLSGEYDKLDLGHFCVVVEPGRYAEAAESSYCVRNSGSGRIWLGVNRSVRVEVRSS